MSEESSAPQVPPQDLDEANSGHIEQDLDQKYQETLDVAKSLDEASTVSVKEAEADISAYGVRSLYAKPDDQGLLILGRSVPKELDEERFEDYQAMIENISTHGYLEPDTKKRYQHQFSARGYDSLYGLYNPLFTGEIYKEPVKMYLYGGETAEEALSEVAQQFGLDEKDQELLKQVSQEKTSVEANPKQGSNFMYQYSWPFVEVGNVNGEVKARIGINIIRRNDGSGSDHVDFRGVSVQADKALEMISGGMQEFAEQAEASKASVADAPTAESLKQKITAEREDSASSFVEQLKKMAPETRALDDQRLIELVKRTAEAHYGAGENYPDVPPAELHVIKVMMDKDASFGGFTKKDNKEVLSAGKDDLPNFWEPHTLLRANGRTGLVTQIDVSSRGTMASGPYEELGREEFDAEKSARLRQQMFETKTQNHLN